MLERSEVRDLALSEGLSECLDQVIDAVRAGYRLEVAPDADATVPAVHKLGGDPDFADGEAWPLSARGARLVFLAQIDCSRLPELPASWPDPDPWPHGGQLIRVFANRLELRGVPCAARAMVTEPAGPLSRTTAPEVHLPLARDAPYEDEELIETDGWLPECVVRPVPFLTAPQRLPGVVDDPWNVSELGERYQRFAARLRTDGARAEPSGLELGVAHLLGEPVPVQDDVRAMATLVVSDGDAARQWEITPDPTLGNPEAWRTLLAIHSDHRIGLEIGDAGALHILVPVADLAINRLDRLMCDQPSC